MRWAPVIVSTLKRRLVLIGGGDEIACICRLCPRSVYILNHPRNGSWTVASVRFCGFLARPHLATATRQPARCKQAQHRQGVAKTYHRRRRALTQKVNVLNPANTNEYVVLQTVSSGQLRFLGSYGQRLSVRQWGTPPSSCARPQG